MESKEGFIRLKKILVRDKQTSPRQILTLVNTDIKSVMNSYVEFGNEGGVFSNARITPNGLEFDVRIICTRMKEINAN